eukprot:gene11626-11721_t
MIFMQGKYKWKSLRLILAAALLYVFTLQGFLVQTLHAQMSVGLAGEICDSLDLSSGHPQDVGHKAFECPALCTQGLAFIAPTMAPWLLQPATRIAYRMGTATDDLAERPSVDGSQMKTYIQTILAAALLFGVTSAALAHITLEKSESLPKSGYKAVFRVPHGCEGSTTTAIKITIPEGVIAAKPMPKAGWTLAMTKGPYANSYKQYGETVTSGVKEITWSGGSLPDDEYDEFTVSTYLTEALAAGSAVYFPVVQTCEKGVANWVGVPKDGQAATGEPAPSVKIIAAASVEGGKIYTVGDLSVANPYLRATPNGAKVAGGFVKITNNDHHPDRLVAVTVDVAGMTMIHEMKMDGAVMKMAELPNGVEIAPHATVALEPGKMHLMLMDLKQPLKAGDKIKGTLTFEKAGKVDVEFVVKGLGGE